MASMAYMGPANTLADDKMRGYCGIGIVNAKHEVNVGTLWRSAKLFGAGFVFTTGRPYRKQASDTMKAWKHLPIYAYKNADDLFDHLPMGCVPVAIELADKAIPLTGFSHPERACYILGAEDNGLPDRLLKRAACVVQIPAGSLNVATAGSIVLYDRLLKRGINS